MKLSKLDWTALDSYFEEEDPRQEQVEALARIHSQIREEVSVKREKEDEDEEEGGGVVKKSRTSIIVPPPTVVTKKSVRIEEIEQHLQRDDQVALFALNMFKSGGGSTNMIINKPPQVDVLAYCARYKDEMPWYMNMQNFVASSSEYYNYPDVTVFSREMIEDFLRSPSNPGERPCINLDQEPCQGDPRIQCVAHRLSSKPENGGKGFKLREMIFGDTLVRVNEAVAKKQDYSKFLDPVPDMCYLCHLWLALRDSTYQRDKKTGDKDSIVIINRFMVQIDKPGEYAREKMLMSDKVNAGLWGPVPLFNETNYIVHSREKRIEESAKLLFRLTRALLPPIDAIPSKASRLSTPSTPTVSSGSRPL